MLLTKGIHKRQKTIAAVFLFAMICETFTPAVSYALTSGPAQPEMKGFEPISNSNMVDAFSGDFSYNIPLMDVDGYPVNLNYRAGATPDDESSWVGYGWSVTPGALNRQLRGLPDDFNGNDQLVKQTNYKDHITKGLTATAKLDALGVPLKGGGSISVGVEYDNYRGIGTKLGLNAGLTIGGSSASAENTNNTEVDAASSDAASGKLSFGLGLSTSSLNGASANVSFPVMKKKIEQDNSLLSASIGFPYNSRAGLQGFSLSASYGPSATTKESKGSTSLLNSFVSFASPSYTPTIDVPSASSSFSASLSAGAQIIPIFLGGGVSGYRTRQYIENADKTRKMNGYGFLYADKGKDDNQALMDFNREKDIPYAKEVQYLPVPIPTNDIFMASSQGEGGQYKIARGGHGVFFDPTVSSKGSDGSFGVELGIGLTWDAGADLFYQNTSNTTNKWKNKNDFLAVGDFNKNVIVNSFKEKAYFKKTGEPVVLDKTYHALLEGDDAVAVKLSNASGNNIGTTAAFRTRNGNNSIGSSLERTKREVRNQPFNYLTAKEAAKHALDKKIYSYPANEVILGSCTNGAVQKISRDSGYRRSHHISEVTITGSDGKRTVYGIPVYNTSQEETSFSISGDTSNRATGLISHTTSAETVAANSNSREKYFSRQTLPAYATSFLLTDILSSDYVDVTGDGITDDDMGNAVKFNYNKLPFEYKWKTPFGANANYNENFISDKLDDKASYTYGTKEIWYLHSIESKTMVALFITENRQDGLGVLSPTAGVDTSHKLKKLTEIRLYSKSDIKEHGNDLSQVTPVKVVHFEYSYSLMGGMPNSIGNVGKLTLKKVYFTYGKSDIGIVHPYTFEYNSDSVSIGSFNHRLYDRWGTYKDKAANGGGLNNSEFPYTVQNQSVTDEFVSRWQLKKINLPTGGSISVTYESDDYAYVQNRRAMQMFRVSGIGSGGNSTSNSGLRDADEIFVDLPVPVTSGTDFMNRYLAGEKYLFFKFFTDLDNLGHSEFVPGYARINSARVVSGTSGSKVAIKLEKEDVEGVGPTNPVTHTAWQFIKGNLPKYAYPGYENLENESSDFVKAIQSLATAVSNLSELIPNSFGKAAKRRNYGNTINLQKSFVRLQSPSYKKLGGGSRVKRIAISDAWQELSGVANSKTATYTQEYNYTKTIKDNSGNDVTISSGVASYEPMLGGEENPFHQPVFYRQNVILQLDNYYYIEEPFCEGLYPAPSVGYSRVSVKNIGSGEMQSRTGEVVNEFYTSKDYPTKVDALSLEKTKYGSSKLLNILTSRITENIGLSQGYRIENNDMHGKPKALSVYNVSGIKIASTEYIYKTLNPNEENGQTDNRVKLLMPDGTVTDGIIGKEVETYTDMRESVSLNEGTKLQGSAGAGGVWIFSIFFLFPGFGSNYDNRSYHSSSTIKIVNNFAVLDKVRKMENGSSITTQNILWDGLTGDVLMTQTQNEFDDPVYNLSIPANWAYSRMGQSYENEGTYLENVATGEYGQVLSSLLSSCMRAGDEIADLNADKRYWAIYTQNRFALIDRDGLPLQNALLTSAKIIRSGIRNILSSPLCTYVTLKNPIVDNRIDISAMSKVITTDAMEYSEEWKVPKAFCSASCPEGYTASADGLSCYKDTAVTYQSGYSGCSLVCDASHYNVYGNMGTLFIFPGGDTAMIDTSVNKFWVQQNNCGGCVFNVAGKAEIVKGQATPEEAPAIVPMASSVFLPNRSGMLNPVLPGAKTDTIATRRSIAQLQQPSTKKLFLPYSAAEAKKKASSYPGLDSSLMNNGPSSKAKVKSASVATNATSHDVQTNAGTCLLTPGARDTHYLGPLHRTGIWSCARKSGIERDPMNTWIGFTKTISVSTTNTYYLGIAADNEYRFYVDGSLVKQSDTLKESTFNYWFIFPITLTAGSHVIRMEAYNWGGPAAMGAEIYNNTPDQIASATDYSMLNLVFSTKDMIGQQLTSGVASCPVGYNLYSNSGSGTLGCRKTVPVNVATYNPYVAGHLGNWRPKTSYAFQTKRENVMGDPLVKGSTNIRKAGAYVDMVPFWKDTTISGVRKWMATGASNNRWVKKNETTAFNPKGFSIEEKDPLNRYSSVLLGYLDTKPIAVASNSKYSELMYDGFEDYSFLLDCASASCAYNHFNFKSALSGSITLDGKVSHSGNMSLKLTGTATVSKLSDAQMSGTDLFSINSTTGLYKPNAGTTWSNGFTAVAGKKYLLSMWIKDNAPRNPTTATQVKVNGTDLINNTLKWPVVEGWKRVEIPFTFSTAGFSLSIVPSGTVWIDDVRIAPFDSQVKSYAYDATSQRLMAEMDENNFATFYEYDSEGTLVRVKKETEKGVVTIKETRSSYRRK